MSLTADQCLPFLPLLPCLAQFHREEAGPGWLLCRCAGVGKLWLSSCQKCGLLLMHPWSNCQQWPPQPSLGSALELAFAPQNKVLILVLTAPHPATCWGMESVEPEHVFSLAGLCICEPAHWKPAADKADLTLPGSRARSEQANSN